MSLIPFAGSMSAVRVSAQGLWGHSMQPLIIADSFASCLLTECHHEKDMLLAPLVYPWFWSFYQVLEWTYSIQILYYIYTFIYFVCVFRTGMHAMACVERSEDSSRGLALLLPQGPKSGCINYSLQTRGAGRNCCSRLAACRMELHIGREREARLGATNLESQHSE